MDTRKLGAVETRRGELGQPAMVDSAVRGRQLQRRGDAAMAVDGNDCVAGHREAEGQQQRWQQRQLELGRPAMAATTLGASGSARKGVNKEVGSE